MAHKTRDRISKIRGADELEEDNRAEDDFGFPDAPYHADARTSHFGKGSKSAGFYYGDTLAVHTKSSKKDGGKVLMMELSGKKFDEKMQNGQDWQQQELNHRRSGDRQSREASVPEWDSLRQLMEELDSCESYTLFLISDIREQRQEELRLEDVPAMASELRDMFMVYTDGVEIGLRGLEAEDRVVRLAEDDRQVHPPSQFKYSKLHINVIAHKLRPGGSHSSVCEWRISLRDDAPALDWEAREWNWDEFGRQHRQGGWTCCALPKMDEVERILDNSMHVLPYLEEYKLSLERSPTRMLELCAPEVFHFRVGHEKLGSISGIALYMPVIEGEESASRIKLHNGSIAMCFWKGRQMPYAKVSKLLPFMPVKNAEDRALKSRVRLMLFFGTIAEVDDCKFKFNDDIEEHLHPDSSRKTTVHAAEPYQTYCKWTAQSGKWTRSNKVAATKDFEGWIKGVHEKYDRACVLTQRLSAEDVQQLEAETHRKRASDKAWFGGVAYARLKLKRNDKVSFQPKGQKIEAAHSGAKKKQLLAGTVLCFEADRSMLQMSAEGRDDGKAATCMVLVRREPVELFGHIIVIKVSEIMSSHAPEISNLEVDERKRAPWTILPAFYEDFGGGPRPGEGLTSAKPLELAAGEVLPVAAVRVQNIATGGDARDLYNWLRPTGIGTSHATLKIRQTVLHMDGSAVQGYGEVVCQVTHDFLAAGGAQVKAFAFTKLALRKAGDYMLLYEVVPVRDKHHPFRTADARATVRPAPSAHMFVRVKHGLPARMQFQIMEKTQDDEATFIPVDELVLGRSYAIDVKLCDEHDNPCHVDDKKGMYATFEKQLAAIDEKIRSGDASPPHFICAEGIRLDYVPDETEYPLQSKLLSTSAKGPVHAVRIYWGSLDHAEKSRKGKKDMRKISPILPTLEAIDAHTFKRAAQPIEVTVHMFLPQPAPAAGEPPGHIQLTKQAQCVVRSDAPLRLHESSGRLARTLAEAQSGPAYNYASLPELTFAIHDEYGAEATPSAKSHVMVRTKPRNSGGFHDKRLDFVSGVATMSAVPRLEKEQLEQPIQLTFSLAGQTSGQSVAADSAVEGWLFVLPSNKPKTLELQGPPGLASSDADVYSLSGKARSQVTGLHLLVYDEAGARVRSDKMELRIQGKQVKGAELAVWRDQGLLPSRDPFRIPRDCSQSAEVTVGVRWPAEANAEEMATEVTLRLHAEAGPPSRFEFHNANGQLGRTRNAEVLRVRNGELLKNIVHVRLTDDDGNPSQLPADLAATLRLGGSDEQGPWFKVGSERVRSLTLADEADGSAGLVRAGGRGVLELRCAIVGCAAVDCTLMIGGAGDEAREGTGEASSTPATAQASRLRRALEEKTISFDLLEGEPDRIRVCDADAFSRRLTRDCFELRLEVVDASGNKLQTAGLQDVKLSVDSSGTAENFKIQWNDQRGEEDGRLTGARKGRSAEGHFVLPFVAWQAPRSVAKIEHKLVVSGKLGSKALSGEHEFKTGCTGDYFVSALVVVEPVGSGEPGGASGDQAVRVVKEGPVLVAGQPAPKLLVRAVMDAQDGEQGQRLVLMEPRNLALAALQGDGPSIPIAVWLEYDNQQVQLEHERHTGADDHFHLAVGTAMSWCAAGALTAAGRYRVIASYSEERPRVLAKLCGAATSERKLAKRKIFEFTVAAGPPAEVVIRNRHGLPDVIECDNASRLKLPALQLQLHDSHGNAVPSDDGEPQLSLEMQRLDDGSSVSSPQVSLPELQQPVHFKPFGPRGESSCPAPEIRAASGRGDAIFSLAICGAATSLQLPQPLKVRFSDASALAEEQRAAHEAQMRGRAAEQQRELETRQTLDQLREEQRADASKHDGLIQEGRTKHSEMMGALAELQRRCARFVESGRSSGLAESSRFGTAAHLLRQAQHVDQSTMGVLESLSAILLAEHEEIRRVSFGPRLGYPAQQQLDTAMQEARERGGGGGGRGAGVHGTVAQLWQVFFFGNRDRTRRVAAVLSDLAGTGNMKAVVVDKKKEGDVLRQRLQPSPKVWALEFMRARDHRAAADPRVLDAAASKLGRQFGWPAGMNAADMLGLNRSSVPRAEGQTEQQWQEAQRRLEGLLRPVLDAVLGNWLVFANEEEGAAYKREEAAQRSARSMGIVCLDGFCMAAAGSYGGSGGRKKTDLNACAEHFGMQPPDEAELSQEIFGVQHVLQRVKSGAAEAATARQQLQPAVQRLKAAMEARQARAAALGCAELIPTAGSRHAPAGVTRARAATSGGADVERAEAVRRRV